MSEQPNARVQFYSEVTRRLRQYDDLYLIPGQGLDIYLQRNFISHDECNELISLIERDRTPSTVLGPSPDPDYRTSDSSALSPRRHPIVQTISDRIDHFLGIEQRFGEPLGGHRYSEGQQFKPHFDWFHTKESYWPEQEKVGGQRTWTAIVCLNTPLAGGGTMFPEAGVRLKPRAGNLLLWCNLAPDGDPSFMALHCGEPVEEGVKYILSKWYRERVFTHGNEGSVGMTFNGADSILPA